jgi:RHS repeat-associated protein
MNYISASFPSERHHPILTKMMNSIPFLKVNYFIIILSILTSQTILAQSSITIQNIIVGKVEVSATNSIILNPGFHAKNGSNFHAYIGQNQAQNSSTLINIPTSNSTPMSGSSSNNYIKTINYREGETIIPTGNFKNLEEIQYFDGLGRPSQSIQVGASPSGKDIIQPVLYDDFDRKSVQTLPYLDNQSNGLFRSNLSISNLTPINNFYSSGTIEGKEPDNRAYTLIAYEDSPLNREVSKTGLGSDWISKPNQTNYLLNSVLKPGWHVTGDYTYAPFNYSQNSLLVIESINEDSKITREYSDLSGKVILKELKYGSDWLRTAYIYDDYGLLRCVVPPAASGPDDVNLCYYYLYDSHKRMIEKRLPGAGTLKMVYDSRDRLRFTQNAMQATTGINEWSFIKYDQFNRPVITGVLKNFSGNSSDLVSAINSSNVSLNEGPDINNLTGYNNASYPNTSNIDILTITYYDNYDFLGISGINSPDSLRSTTYDNGDYNIQNKLATSNKGSITGNMTAVISDPVDAGLVPKNKIYSAIYYDKYGHVLRTISENHLKGKDINTNLFEDITYNLVQCRQEHYKGPENIKIEKWYDYDHTGRLLATREKVNDQPTITLSAFRYNEVGELITKFLHSNQTSNTLNFIQKIDYRYNIRGWLTKINDPSLVDDNDIFGMQLFYNSVNGMGGLAPVNGLYNGNIVGIKWTNKNDITRGYQFVYDDLNRMLNANYADGNSLSSSLGYFSENICGYDNNGNITNLKRFYNNILVDSLTYKYQDKSNQIRKIYDSGTPNPYVDDYPGNSQNYSYDLNGNMNYDAAKNLNINYSRTLNLPQMLDFGSNNRIYFHYSATGGKIIKHLIQNTGVSLITQYIGNIVYEGGNLKYILTEEGRLIADGSGTQRKFLYEYELKDHLGSNRVTFMGTDLGGAVDIVQSTSYYPFGLVMNQFNANTDPTQTRNKYLYNNKEIQDDRMTSESLNWYDYGARSYDSQIGIFHTMDAFAEKYFAFSPYQYAANNPLIFIDINGDSIRQTRAFMNNARMLSAYNEWIQTDAGKQFIKLFGKGGEYESVAVVLDLINPLESSAKGETSTELVNTNDPSKSEYMDDGDGKIYKNISATILGKDHSHYVRFNLAFNDKQKVQDINFALAIDHISHEKQHMDIRLKYLLEHKTMPPSFRYEHNLMRDERLQYFNERYRTFDVFSKYWIKDFYLIRKNEDTKEAFIKYYINDFDDQ